MALIPRIPEAEEMDVDRWDAREACAQLTLTQGAWGVWEVLEARALGPPLSL